MTISPLLPPAQLALQTRCRHPSNSLSEFTKADLATSIPARFEKMVARYPERLAVKSEMHCWTYTQLNQMANRIAHTILRHCGEGAEPIALLLNNDAPMVAAILGVLKAGKFYVPLDPAFPSATLAHFLQDSTAGLVVSSQEHRPLVAELADVAADSIEVDDLRMASGTDNPQLPIRPDALANIVYTSGSTGSPKGIFTNHRNILHLALRVTHNFQISPEDRFANIRSMSFNGALKDIFCSLLNGAMVLPFNLAQRGFHRLKDWMFRENITICISVPSTLRQLAHVLSDGGQLPQLRIYCIGGDRLLSSDLRLFKQHFAPNALLIPGFATAETLPVAHYYCGDQTPASKEGILPAGYPLDDMEICIVDGAGEPVDCGEVGEIWVRSPYLALGYWRNEALTEQKFLPDPDGGEWRIYRSGDIGYVDDTGCLFCLGRADSQVKVRGHRIELTEIEQTLASHPALREVAIVTHQNPHPNHGNEQRLLAYVVPVQPPGPNATELRQFLADRLPAYKIPALFIALDRMPLTRHGKLDRRALPAPSNHRPQQAVDYVAPQTPVETELARIWAEVLELELVGIHDLFLELGGDSLLATQIITRVFNRFGVEVPLKSLLEAPTVAEMALLITQFQSQTINSETLEQFLSELDKCADDHGQGDSRGI